MSTKNHSKITGNDQANEYDNGKGSPRRGGVEDANPAAGPTQAVSSSDNCMEALPVSARKNTDESLESPEPGTEDTDVKGCNTEYSEPAHDAQSEVRKTEALPMFEEGDKVTDEQPHESNMISATAYGDLEMKQGSSKEDIQTGMQMTDNREELMEPTEAGSEALLQQEANPEHVKTDKDFTFNDTDGIAEHQRKLEDVEPETTTKKRRFESPTAGSDDLSENNEDTNKKLLSIQEITRQEHKAECEQPVNEITDSPVAEHSLFTDGGARASDVVTRPPDNETIAEQSCRENGYTDEQIEQAKHDFKQHHDSLDVYSGRDLAEIIMQREDEVKEEPPDDPSPPSDNQDSSTCDSDGFGPPAELNIHEDDSRRSGHYITTATVRDNGHPHDGSSSHTIIVDVLLKKSDCCDSQNIRFNYVFP